MYENKGREFKLEMLLLQRKRNDVDHQEKLSQIPPSDNLTADLIALTEIPPSILKILCLWSLEEGGCS